MRTLPVLILVVIVSVAQGASAADDPKKLFEVATAEFNLGHYQKAASMYEDIYKITLEPVLLYNIAQAHRLGGDFDKAIFFYRGYLRAQPQARNHVEVQKRITELEEAIAAKRRGQERPPNVPATVETHAQPQPATAPTPTSPEPATQPRAVETPPATTPPPTAEAQPAPATASNEAPSSDKPIWKKWWFWTIIGGVVVVAVVVTVAVVATRTVVRRQPARDRPRRPRAHRRAHAHVAAVGTTPARGALLMRATVVVAAAALALAGCKNTPENGYAVDVTVKVDSSVPSATLAQVATLDISVSGAETFHTQDAINGQLNSGTAKFIYRPLATSGVLQFTVAALDSSGATVALGQGSATLKNGQTVVLTVTLTAGGSLPDMTAVDLAASDMSCEPESDADFCTRLGKNCETVTDNDNCGTTRTVTSCGTCSGAAPACVANVCSVPVCGTAFAASVTVSAVSVAAVQDDLLGASASGDALLLLRPATGACGVNTLFIADATTSGSMTAYNIQNINAVTGFQKAEETMTLSGDGLTIIGTDPTGKAFTTSTRTAAGMTNFGAAAVGPFAAINAAIGTLGGTVSWPVISSDGLAFYYRLGGATSATDNGSYEALRATTAANFPVATKMPAAVQAFDGISGISSDRMTLFMENAFATQIMTRNSLSAPFTVPTASTPPAGWRAVPVANCAKVIGTCEPGGCQNEDICTWAKM